MVFFYSEFKDSRSYYHGIIKLGDISPYYSLFIATCQVYGVELLFDSQHLSA
jgi:hypothetical protein